MPILKIKTQVRTDLRSEVGDRKYHDENAIADVIDYVLREDKAPGEMLGGFAVNPIMAKEQFKIIAQAYGKDFGVRLRHMILSFSPNEHVELHEIKNIAYQVAAYYGCNYQIIWAVHTDKQHQHIHMVMNTVSYQTGRKYGGEKSDYYRFIDHINTILYPYGLYVTTCSDREDNF